MTAFNAYRQTTERQWTRIDMLIALYEATGQELARGRDLAQEGHIDQMIPVRIRATQLLLAILSGIDAQFDEVASNTQRLIIYCLDQVTGTACESWNSAWQTIETLTEGFRGIRREAQRLQLEGTIPDPFAEPLHTLSAG